MAAGNEVQEIKKRGGAMHYSKCKFCGKVFVTKRVQNLCQNCKTIDENLFSKIEDYLRQFPHSNAMQIAEGCGISVLDVLQYIDEGRLQISKGEFKRL